MRAEFRHTILLVDDEEFIINALSQLLKRKWHIISARSGKEAIELLKREKIHVILSDQRMPGMTGVELLSLVRVQYPAIMRLLISGYSDIEAIVDAVNLGHIYRYIMKPWDPVELDKVLCEACAISESLYAQYENVPNPDPKQALLSDRATSASKDAVNPDLSRQAAEISTITTTPSRLYEIFEMAIHDNADEIHLEPVRDATDVRFRIGHNLFNKIRLDPTSAQGLLANIKQFLGIPAEETGTIFHKNVSYTHAGGVRKLEVSAIPSIYGSSLIIKLFRPRTGPRDIHTIGFNEREEHAITELLDRRKGLIIVTGPIQSGRKTTLYSFLNQVTKADRKQFAIGDSIPYEVENCTHVDLSRVQKGLSIPEILAFILDKDPDTVLIENIKDNEIYREIFLYALRGKLVLAGCSHADVFTVLNYLKDLNLGMTLLSDTLKLIIAQRLVRRLCSTCKKPIKLPPSFKARLKYSLREDPPVYEAGGCTLCHHGYSGYLLLTEMLLMTEKVREMIAMKRPVNELMMYLQGRGFKSLQDIAMEKLLEGQTSIEELHFLE